FRSPDPSPGAIPRALRLEIDRCFVACQLVHSLGQLEDRRFAPARQVVDVAGFTCQSTTNKALNNVCDEDEISAGGPTVVNLKGQAFLGAVRSEEHTSELQSRSDLVCRLLP